MTNIRISLPAIILSLLLLCSCNALEDNMTFFKADHRPTKEELDQLYEPLWSKEELALAKSTADISYLTPVEKEIFFYLNLARMNPPLFARTYAKGYEGHKGSEKGYAFDKRKSTLIQEMSEMKPLPLVYHDPVLYESAKCFAEESGELGIRGHDRSETSCNQVWSAESCYYGNCEDGLIIIMSLLIDFGKENADLGHRRLCLSKYYTAMGASIQPHVQYTNVVVMDF